MIKKIFFILLLVFGLAVSGVAYAQDGNLPAYVPLEPLPGVTPTGTTDDVTNLLSFIFKVLFTLGGFIAVVALVMGGIVYMTSEIANKKAEAIKRIQAAFWGIAILALSWLILNTINPDLLRFKFGIMGSNASVSISTKGGPCVEGRLPQDQSGNTWGFDSQSGCADALNYGGRLQDVTLPPDRRVAILLFDITAHPLPWYQESINKFQTQCTLKGGKPEPIPDVSWAAVYVCVKAR